MTKIPKASDALADLLRLGDPIRAEHSLRFFKTGPGQYGEGDRFLGMSVPVVRRLAKTYDRLPDAEIETLLASPWHEARLLGLVVWTDRAKRLKEPAAHFALAKRYLAARRGVNNWDLVDVSAPGLLGEAIFRGFDGAPLDKMIRAKGLWDRRIAMVATLGLIRRGVFDRTIAYAEALLGDEEDLMHKASGWMLREAGKKNAAVLRGFLARHAGVMPRTMLRYAIERLPPVERRRWMDAPAP